MLQVVVALGSNIERKKNIKMALEQLTNIFGELVISPVYESAPNVSSVKSTQEHSGSLAAEVAAPQHLNYYNLIVSFESNIAVDDVKENLQQIEEDQHRERGTLMVTIDLDLLLYGDWVGSLNGSEVPHKDILQSAFVLKPLVDLFPDKIHPIKAVSYQSLWSSFKQSQSLIPVVF